MPRRSGGFRVGDRVVLDEMMPIQHFEEATQRGLLFGVGGYVASLEPGEVCEVMFADDRCAFMRYEDLRLLTPVEERVYRKEEDRARRRLRAQALATGAYYTPETVSEAFGLGNGHGYRDEPHMARRSFLVTATDHPFPESLWKAYRRGYRVGRRHRLSRPENQQGGIVPPASNQDPEGNPPNE